MLIKYIIKDVFVPWYEKWLPIRKEILDKKNKSHNYIFIKSNGDPAGESTARTWVEKIEKILGVPFYAHSLRHRFTTYLSSKGIPSELIKEIVGWTTLDMVGIYNDLTAKDKKWEGLENLK
jgi:integrase